MSKLKVLEINKQLKTSADQTMGKYNGLLKEAQASFSVVKKLEAELIKKAKAHAEENKIRKEKEELAEKEIKVAEMNAPEAVEIELDAKPALEAKPVTETKPVTQAKSVTQAKPVTATVVPETAKTKPVEAPKADAPKLTPEEEAEKIAQAQRKRMIEEDERQRAARKAAAIKRKKAQQAAANKPAGQNNRQGTGQNTTNRPTTNRQTNYRPTGTGQNRRPNTTQSATATNRSAANKPAANKPATSRPVARQNAKPKSGYQPVRGNSPYNKAGNNKSGGKGQFDKYGNKKNKRSFNRNNIDIYQDDAKMRGPRKKQKRMDQKLVIETKVIDNAVITTEEVSVKVLAEKTGKPVTDILKKLMLLGVMATINSEIDFDTAQLICTEFNIALEKRLEKTAEDTLVDVHDDEVEEGVLIKRPPVVTIMGHVDHGKTSLLDAIRETKITESEAGGITQHIGAYTIMHGKEPITFLDTPGHEAFTAMRARGAQVTDIAILVIAADDGVMPQTVEAINHAKDAGVPIIIAINKIDRPDANPDKIKQELTEYNVLAEEWGGDVIMVPVSAITKEGIEKLLETILLVSEMLDLKANPNRLAKGTIVEAKLDKGRGPVATVLITTGTLKVSDGIVAGTAYGKVRAMVNDDGDAVLEAGPSTPVEVIGFSEVPGAGDVLHAVGQDKLTRKVVQERKDKLKAEKLKNISKVSLDDLFDKIAEGNLKNLNIVVKADVQGSAEAISQALEKISNEEVKVVVKHAGVGAVAEADVLLASVANAIIIGFNVRPDTMARKAADRENVDIRLYRVIYDAIEDVEKAMIGMLDPEFKEEVLGHVEVREIFKASAIGTIAGCYVQDGKINRNAQLRLLRDNIVIHEGTVGTLRRFKDDAKEVSAGYECGISIENYNNIEVGDVIEAFEMRKVER